MSNMRSTRPLFNLDLSGNLRFLFWGNFYFNPSINTTLDCSKPVFTVLFCHHLMTDDKAQTDQDFPSLILVSVLGLYLPLPFLWFAWFIHIYGLWKTGNIKGNQSDCQKLKINYWEEKNPKHLLEYSSEFFGGFLLLWGKIPGRLLLWCLGSCRAKDPSEPGERGNYYALWQKPDGLPFLDSWTTE